MLACQLFMDAILPSNIVVCLFSPMLEQGFHMVSMSVDRWHKLPWVGNAEILGICRDCKESVNSKASQHSLMFDDNE